MLDLFNATTKLPLFVQFTCLVVPVAFIFTLLLHYSKLDVLRFIQSNHGSKVIVAKKESSTTINKEKLKEIYRQKDSQIKMLEARVMELEKDINLLQSKTKANKIDTLQKESNVLLQEYEQLIEKVMEDNDNLRKNKEVMTHYLVNMENSFKVLLEKYQRAREAITGLEASERELRKLAGIVASTDSTPVTAAATTPSPSIALSEKSKLPSEAKSREVKGQSRLMKFRNTKKQ